MGKRVAYVAGMASLVAILGLLSALPSGLGRVGAGISIAGVPVAGRTLVIAIAALAGFGVSAAHVVPNSILPDGIEWEELRTGSRKEGFFFGIVSLLNKVGTSVAVPWVALVLAAVGFDESRGAGPGPGHPARAAPAGGSGAGGAPRARGRSGRRIPAQPGAARADHGTSSRCGRSRAARR